MHHILQIIVIRHRDQSVELLAGKLVLESKPRRNLFGRDNRRELRQQCGEFHGPIDGENFGLAADVREEIVVSAGLDFTAVANHEFNLLIVE